MQMAESWRGAYLKEGDSGRSDTRDQRRKIHRKHLLSRVFNLELFLSQILDFWQIRDINVFVSYRFAYNKYRQEKKEFRTGGGIIIIIVLIIITAITTINTTTRLISTIIRINTRTIIIISFNILTPEKDGGWKMTLCYWSSAELPTASWRFPNCTYVCTSCKE